MSIAKIGKPAATSAAHEAALEKGFEALTTLARLLKVDAERVISQSGMSQPMVTALSGLGRLPDQTTVSELSRSLTCNMGNLSGTLDRLEEAGYIEKIVCEADRRARFIRLTAKGRRAVSQLTEAFQCERVCNALKRMDVKQLEAMTESINRLSSTVQADASS